MADKMETSIIDDEMGQIEEDKGVLDCIAEARDEAMNIIQTPSNVIIIIPANVKNMIRIQTQVPKSKYINFVPFFRIFMSHYRHRQFNMGVLRIL